jgi:hypothetical protein
LLIFIIVKIILDIIIKMSIKMGPFKAEYIE